ncbi:uncharacterized protein LOC112595700 isoform X1 [Melanaphis sacchari]|uniref:uncharacterized protein LOC112595700 isoform X1 n=1 Tax=Melanaphis sacchari TaxID=742174 RepID=UPI000DC15230|nr:uncharacterized protein LOC112595700 isoform X1 [Melanaphis sacchari]
MNHLQNARLVLAQNISYKRINLQQRVDHRHGNNTVNYYSKGQREEKYLLDLSIPSVYSSIDEYLDSVFKKYDFKNTRVICIDGTCGTGKSTLIKKSNRLYFKINSLFLLITNTSSYNHNPINSKRYITTKDIIEYKDEAKSFGVCWDRDRYSNLRWQYIHQLVHHYSSRGLTIPTDNEFEVFGVLNNFATRNNLCEILEYHENRERELILVLTCRDILFLSVGILHRALSINSCDPESVINNDSYNSKEANYLIAQNYVYYWFAKLKGDPCLDISCVYKYFEDLDANSFQSKIIERINYAHKSASFDLKTTDIRELVTCGEGLSSLDDAVCADQIIQTMFNNTDDTMIYKYSMK